jgi:hypothetical protein
MSWNPNQQQIPNPSNPYGDYTPSVIGDYAERYASQGIPAL